MMRLKSGDVASEFSGLRKVKPDGLWEFFEKPDGKTFSFVFHSKDSQS